MKYIKRFNEELSPRVYNNAAKKLDKLGHTDRSDALKGWSQKMENDENLIKWKDNLQDYALFGTFKLNIENPDTKEKLVGDFYLDITFDPENFSDGYESEKNKQNIKDSGFAFFVGIIPCSEDLIEQCNKIMPTAEMNNGFYWGFIFEIKFDITMGQIDFTKLVIENYDDGLSGNVSLADRRSAGLLLSLLKRMFSDPNLDYPSGRTDIGLFYDSFEKSILAECGFSSEYGFKLSQISDFLKTINPNNIYKTPLAGNDMRSVDVRTNRLQS